MAELTEARKKELLGLIRGSIKVSTGCTEPVAIAYAAALCRQRLTGEIQWMKVLVNTYIFKNVMGVAIPGYDRRGLLAAAALGLAVGDGSQGLNLLAGVGDEHRALADTLLNEDRISYELAEDCDVFFTQAVLRTSAGCVRVSLAQYHDNVVEVCENAPEAFEPGLIAQYNVEQQSEVLRYELEDFIDFARTVPAADIAFLEEGVRVNLAAAEAGLAMMKQSGVALDVAFDTCGCGAAAAPGPAQLCMAASYARMAGESIPVMTSTGSGNHGITLFLTVYAYATAHGFSGEQMLRALALGQLVNLYIKTHTGLLSAMCGCGIAAGIGAAAGIVYMEGGSTCQILGAIRNLVGSISGIVCDGAKEGCAYKLALSSGWAVQAARLALNGAVIGDDGIVAPGFERMIQNLGQLCREGMRDTNRVIINTMVRP